MTNISLNDRVGLTRPALNSAPLPQPAVVTNDDVFMGDPNPTPRRLSESEAKDYKSWFVGSGSVLPEAAPGGLALDCSPANKAPESAPIHLEWDWPPHMKAQMPASPQDAFDLYWSQKMAAVGDL